MNRLQDMFDAWVRRKKKKVSRMQRTFAFHIWAKIVERTPVDTGRARANWNLSMRSPDKTLDKHQNVSMENVPEPKDDKDEFFITNNLPYISTLEYGGYPDPVQRGSYDKKTKSYVKKSDQGYSRQAPHGMVGVTLAEANNIFKDTLEEMNRERMEIMEAEGGGK